MSRSKPHRASLWRWFVLAPMCVSLFVAEPALAAGGKLSPEERQAQALFDQGLALSDDGKWSEALDAFKKSDELRHSASVRFNMAVTYRALGRYVEAKRVADELLSKGVDDKPLKPALEKEVEKLRDEVAPKIVSVVIKRSPADASVEIDGALFIIGSDGRIDLDPGKHVFVLKKDGYETTTTSRTIEGTNVDVALTAPLIKVAAPTTPETPFYKKGWFWGTVGAVVAAGAAVTVVVLVTRSDGSQGAGPPPSTVGRVIPAAFTVRF